jgi:hypothetical protein
MNVRVNLLSFCKIINVSCYWDVKNWIHTTKTNTPWNHVYEPYICTCDFGRVWTSPLDTHTHTYIHTSYINIFRIRILFYACDISSLHFPRILFLCATTYYYYFIFFYFNRPLKSSLYTISLSRVCIPSLFAFDCY